MLFKKLMIAAVCLAAAASCGVQKNSATLGGKKCMVIGNSMLYYGGFVQNGEQGNDDPGLLKKLLVEHHGNAYVVDCTHGGHCLCDYSVKGCMRKGKSCTGVDHLANVQFPLGNYDYLFISEAGSNNRNFLSDALTVIGRFKEQNPNIKCFYINHIYSVFKNHDNILGNLKTLHEEYGVDIINCGQLAYDIYSGAVKIPGGRLSFSDKFTFVNHCKGDSHHPNPLMGYIMAQMVYCALSGEGAEGEDYMALLESSLYASGSISLDEYTAKYYTEPAALPFLDVLGSEADMKGIQQLIPMYINKF